MNPSDGYNGQYPISDFQKQAMSSGSQQPFYPANPFVPRQLPSKRPKSRIWILLIGGGILAVSLIAVILVSLTAGNKAAKETSQLAVLRTDGGSLTAQELQSFNKTTLFFALFRNAAEQQHVTTTTEYYPTSHLNQQSTGILTVWETGYDYRTKHFSYQDATHYAKTNTEDIDRCVGTQLLENDTLFPKEGWKPGHGLIAGCSVKSFKMLINDGLNTGGLTEAQANTFVNSLQSAHFITVQDAQLTTLQNKPVIRFDITTHVGPHGSVSMGYFESAFTKTGLNPSNWPYNVTGGGNTIGHIAYFVDPTTQLPVYSQTETSPAASGGMWNNRLVAYSFNKLSTLSTENTIPPSITVPWQTLK